MSLDFMQWSMEEIQQKLESRAISSETLKLWVIWHKANHDPAALRFGELQYGLEQGFLTEEHKKRWEFSQSTGAAMDSQVRGSMFQRIRSLFHTRRTRH
jgi:hypothetical protein